MPKNQSRVPNPEKKAMPAVVRKNEIVRGLRRLGIERGDSLLVHSSLSSLGYVVGGVEAVIDALLEAVGPEGTVMVPTLTGSPRDKLIPPIFDPQKTPCWTGVIPEAFRKRPEALRSRHPTHSVAAIGKLATEFIRDHEYSETPCGPETPYGRLMRWGGKILLLGVGLRSNTCFHGLEEEVGAPYVVTSYFVEAKIVNPDGSLETVRIKVHPWGTPRDYTVAEPLLLEGGAMHFGLVGEAICRLLDAKMMRQIILPILRRDPWFWVK